MAQSSVSRRPQKFRAIEHTRSVRDRQSQRIREEHADRASRRLRDCYPGNYINPDVIALGLQEQEQEALPAYLITISRNSYQAAVFDMTRFFLPFVALFVGKGALASVLGHQTLYRRIVARGLAQNPAPPRTGKRGHPANGVCRSLLLRLQKREDAVLRFALDFAVPFDNNQAERDLRMIKVQQKVSGCFRSVEGADHFCRIRDYISTLHKQGRSVLEALRSVFMGDPIYPCLETPV